MLHTQLLHPSAAQVHGQYKMFRRSNFDRLFLLCRLNGIVIWAAMGKQFSRTASAILTNAAGVFAHAYNISIIAVRFAQEDDWLPTQLISPPWASLRSPPSSASRRSPICPVFWRLPWAAAKPAVSLDNSSSPTSPRNTVDVLPLASLSAYSSSASPSALDARTAAGLCSSYPALCAWFLACGSLADVEGSGGFAGWPLSSLALTYQSEVSRVPSLKSSAYAVITGGRRRGARLARGHCWAGAWSCVLHRRLGRRCPLLLGCA
jgi:hypothetical protein